MTEFIGFFSQQEGWRERVIAPKDSGKHRLIVMLEPKGEDLSPEVAAGLVDQANQSDKRKGSDLLPGLKKEFGKWDMPDSWQEVLGQIGEAFPDCYFSFATALLGGTKDPRFFGGVYFHPNKGLSTDRAFSEGVEQHQLLVISE